MSEVNRIDSERLLQLIFVLHPENTKHSNDQMSHLLISFGFILDVRATFIDNINFHRGVKGSPECCAVKVDHHPLGRVEDKRVSELDALQRPAELRTDVG